MHALLFSLHFDNVLMFYAVCVPHSSFIVLLLITTCSVEAYWRSSLHSLFKYRCTLGTLILILSKVPVIMMLCSFM